MLLRNEHIQPNQQDTNHGRTALSWVSGNEREGVVRLFLGPRFANLGSTGRWWWKGARALGQLFGRRYRYVNPESLSAFGQTPLTQAARNEHD